MNVGQKCLSCKRPMRPQRSKREDWPGTVAHRSRGLCSSCDKARLRGGVPGPRRPHGARRETCKECRRPMRHSSVLAQDAPGTVSYNGRGLCTRCARNPGTPVQGYWRGVVPCRGCEHPTRPAQSKAADYPGTRVRRKQGFCHTCLRDGTAAQILAMAEQVAAWRDRSRAA